ncbi:MAG TPA: GtrA family protein [Solirubrobacteraceae bacterium]|nr:GtrA family protein [Solirubrobacteraceae bacterium]
MSEEMSTAVVELPFHHRVRIGIRKGDNWLQLIRFGGVGASGYIVNLVTFALCVHVLQIDYQISSPIAYFVATTNNFWWNRHWTFGHKREAHPMQQAWKFYAVSLVSFGFNYLVLVVCVETFGIEKVLAQAIANALGTPINFLGQKLWSFRA